jgi:Fic family protein
MAAKEKIIKLLEKFGNLTIEEMHNKTGIKKNTIRVAINRSLKPEFIQETDHYRNKFKVYKLANSNSGKEINNNNLKNLVKGFKSFNSLFYKLSKEISQEGKISLSKYRELISESIDRDLIKQLNKQIEEGNI